LPKFDAFFSYAREDFSRYLDKFFRDLKEEVRLLLGRAKADPILFRDEEDIDIGKPWRLEIATALQSAQVLIAIQTPRYFTRPYCGKEFGIMLRRQSRLGPLASRISGIIPVNWCPCANVPTAVKQFQQAHAQLPATYNTHGLLVLTRNNRYRSEYFDCIRFFAARIAAAVQQATTVPALERLPDFDDAPDAFQTATLDRSADQLSSPPLGPRCARFYYAVGTRSQLREHKRDCSRYDEERGEFWKPFLNAGAIGVLAGRTASMQDFVTDLLRPEPSLVKELESAEDRNNLVIIIVDTWTLDECDTVRLSLEEFDRRPSTHCAVLVVWNEADPDTDQWRPALEERVERTFPIISSREQTYFQPSVGSAVDFETVLAETLRRLQAKILAHGLRKRVLPSRGFRPIPVLDTHSERVNDG